MCATEALGGKYLVDSDSEIAPSLRSSQESTTALVSLPVMRNRWSHYAPLNEEPVVSLRSTQEIREILIAMNRDRRRRSSDEAISALHLTEKRVARTFVRVSCHGE